MSSSSYAIDWWDPRFDNSYPGRLSVEHQHVCLLRQDLLNALHPLAVGGHEIARAGLNEVDAGPAKDSVEGTRSGVADPVVA
jgi:hypothetical protein